MYPLFHPRSTRLWRHLRRLRPAQAALAWLLLALVIAPTLGRLHQVVHAPALEHMHAGHAHGLPAALWTAAEGAAPHASGNSHDHGHVLEHLLWAQHAPEDCLLLDQLALGDALCSATQALPAAVPAQAPLPQHAGRSAAPHVALFQARGPPAA